MTRKPAARRPAARKPTLIDALAVPENARKLSRACSELAAEAAEIMRRRAAAKAADPVTKTLERIAAEHLRIEPLAPRRSDSLDFHERGVWEIEAALRAAYEAGRAAASTAPRTVLRGDGTRVRVTVPD